MIGGRRAESRRSRYTRRLVRAFRGPEEREGPEALESRVPHPYERLVPSISLLPYWVLLPAMGLVVFLGGEVTVSAFGDRDFRITQAIFAIGLGIGPALLIFLSHTFDSTLAGEGTNSLASVLWRFEDEGDQGLGQKEFADWLAMWQRHIFGLQTRRARVSVLFVEVAGLGTLLWSGLPFESPLLNAGCLVLFAALLWLCGHAAFTFAQLLRLLSDIGCREVYVPFSRIPHPALSALQRYYSWLALLTVLGYVVLALAISEGPYGLSVAMISWLSVLAFFPIAGTTWSFVQIHALLRRAKQHHLDEANALVVASLRTAKKTGRASDLEAVQKALAVQDDIRRLSEWPFALSSTLAFAAALSAVAAQATIAWATWAKH